ncbi:hypothetical protein [Streptomyces sp. NPDC051000]|uniref:hypothetical protein n=1 Tax=Streptomyces sp. NPDC051000 TaxID=3155520 RepID=UPI0033D82A82
MAATVNAAMIVFVVAFGILDLAAVPPVVALCRSFHGEDSAIVFGWINTAHQIGAALAALLGGVVRDAFGSYDPVWFAPGAACAGAALVSMLVRTTGPRPPCGNGPRRGTGRAQPSGGTGAGSAGS